MSGLEPLAALGLACNILQLVELGDKTIDLIKTVYQGRRLDEGLEQNAAALGTLSNEVKKSSGQSGGNNLEKSLLTAAEKCSKAAGDLGEEIRFLIGNARQGSLVSPLKVAGKVTWRKRRLERLKRILEQAEKQMQTGLLAKIWSSTNAAELDLSGVRQEFRGFIGQYKRGHRETTALVSSEGSKTRQQISNEAKRTNKAVARVDHKTDRIMFVQEAQVDAQARERFLQSLRYPGLNERRNQVVEAYSKSLRWVFAGDNDDEDDEDTQSDYSYDSDEDSDSWATESDEGRDSGNEVHGSRGSVPEAEGDNHADQQREEFSQIKWDSFSNWLSSTDAIYWISGKPGSGKTTLVKYILNHERTRRYLDIWSPGCKIVSHYFWRPGFRLQKNLSDDALKGVMSCVPTPKDSHTDWSRAELRSALGTALHAYEDGVCLFVDGIDEIHPQDESEPGIPEFLDWALELSQGTKIKLCLASRPDPHILETRLSQYPRLRLQDLNYQDLLAYAKGHIDLSGVDLSIEIWHWRKPINYLVEKAEGVFLWLILATKSINEGLENGDDAALLRERIERFPKGLDSLYQDMWERVGADNPLQYRQTAALYFKAQLQWQITHWSLVNLRLLILVLATTSLNDEILDSLDDPSKLVSQDIMLRKCQEVEKRLNVYCFGLTEVVPGERYETKEVANRSWYGRKYDSVFHHAHNRRLQFIHRTARDFLTDTEMGAKVLAFDTTSNYAVHYRLVKAYLATRVIFAERFGTGVDNWVRVLSLFHRQWKDTDDWASKDHYCLILLCEKLANFSRLFLLAGPRGIPCAGVKFLNEVISYGIDDDFVISRVKNGELSTNEKSQILLHLTQRKRFAGLEPSDVGTFRELLKAGADPNWQGCTQAGPHLHSPYADLCTPWQRYLWYAFEWAVITPWREPRVEISNASDVLQLASLFIMEGARLDELVNMPMSEADPDDGIQRVRIINSFKVLNTEKCLIASIPAYMILELVIRKTRYHTSEIENGIKPERLEELGLVKYNTSWRQDMRPMGEWVREYIEEHQSEWPT
ncbi:hypothetical protein N0V82_008768 [Gnomoniopsis sp. IMI 355080]|nr:hypothetical protein N0V82_008768 [Gnomoniopsis sp. IMI 355080]